MSMQKPNQNNIWNNGMMEKWNIGDQKRILDIFLFLISANSVKKRFHSIKPIIPTLHYSNLSRRSHALDMTKADTPWPSFAAQLIFSYLARRGPGFRFWRELSIWLAAFDMIHFNTLPNFGIFNQETGEGRLTFNDDIAFERSGEIVLRQESGQFSKSEHQQR